jgi:tryptophanyl-tRNA synthetase
VIPEVGARIMDLQDPGGKMSTTYSSDAGLIFIDDEADAIRRKVKRAQTDSGTDVVRAPEKPGITNLIEIMAAATGEPPDRIEARYDGAGYGTFKDEVAEAVVELLDPVRLRFGELRGDPDRLRAILAQGAEKAQAIASETLANAYERVGFVKP